MSIASLSAREACGAGGADVPASRPGRPWVSVVILNYNGAVWLERCLASLRAQTCFDDVEIVIADNASTDGSDDLSRRLLADFPRAVFVANGGNLGYCAGNNRGAAAAAGGYLLFLNNDTWLEPDCLERLRAEVERTGAGAAGPLIRDYDSDHFQHIGGTALDPFGVPNYPRPPAVTREFFAVCGCAYLIRADLFARVGGFDEEFFLYSDETDLSWRVWIAGERIVAVPSAIVHHRGAALANPAGGTRVVESRTTVSKRFYANRNGMLFLLKNAQHVLLLLVLTHWLLLVAETLASLVLVRRWGFTRDAYLRAFADCWRLRGHVWAERRRIRGWRRRGDFGMLRFLTLVPSRLHDVRQMLRHGVPRVDPR